MSSTLKVHSPYDNRLIEELPFADDRSIEQALDTAFNLFQDSSKHIPKYERVEILSG